MQEPRKPDAANWNPDPTYLRSLLERAGLSQRAAAKLLGIPNRTFRAYMMAEAECPYAVQYALEVLAEHFPQKDPNTQSEADNGR